MGNSLKRKYNQMAAQKNQSTTDPMAVDAVDIVDDPVDIDLTNDDDDVILDDDQKDIDPTDANNTNSSKIQQNQPPQRLSPPQFKFVWQWVENDGTWHDYDSTTQLLLDNLSIGNKITITAGKWTYDITRTSNDQCSYVSWFPFSASDSISILVHQSIEWSQSENV